MIEAVNAVVSNAPLVRAQADQVDVAHAALAASAVQASEESSSGGPRAPYVSPYVFVDVNFDKAVLQLRDGDSGDVVQQFPSESTLEARRRAEAFSTKNAKVAAEVRGDQGEARLTVTKSDAKVEAAPQQKQNQPAPVALPSVGTAATTAVQAQAASAALEKSAHITSPSTSGEGVSA